MGVLMREIDEISLDWPVYLYVLELEDGSFYTGMSTNIIQRQFTHFFGKTNCKSAPVRLKMCIGIISHQENPEFPEEALRQKVNRNEVQFVDTPIRTLIEELITDPSTFRQVRNMYKSNGDLSRRRFEVAKQHGKQWVMMYGKTLAQAAMASRQNIVEDHIIAFDKMARRHFAKIDLFVSNKVMEARLQQGVNHDIT